MPRYAFLGVRPCDLRAIFIQDRVLGNGMNAGSAYAKRRSMAFIIAVNCTEPGETCFCGSMGTGPASGPGFDLALTELTGPESAGHKLGTWHDQFGSSGCVGCGRCIVWCPVGIDITEEVTALRAEAVGLETG